jgi:hypothetical protein
VSSTPTLRPPPPRFPLDVHPLGRLHAEGRLELLGPAFPPFGPLVLALWRPGEDPAFSLTRGRLARGWRWEGRGEGFVLAWLAVEAPAEPF